MCYAKDYWYVQITKRCRKLSVYCVHVCHLETAGEGYFSRIRYFTQKGIICWVSYSNTNPLWVFQCAATYYTTYWMMSSQPVSIPYGFSNALRLSIFRAGLEFYYSFNPLWVFQCAATFHFDISSIQNSNVSIPYGFSNALRHHATVYLSPSLAMFQSLMGFPMRCDRLQ